MVRIERAWYSDEIVRQHQHEDRHWHQYREEGAGAFDAELGFAIAERGDDNRQAGEAVQHEHDDGVHRVTHQRGVGLSGKHHGDDQADFDDGDGECQHQRAEWLTDAKRDHLGVVHRGDHVAEQQHGGQQGQWCEADFTDSEPYPQPDDGQSDRVQRDAIGWCGNHGADLRASAAEEQFQTWKVVGRTLGPADCCQRRFRVAPPNAARPMPNRAHEDGSGTGVMLVV